MALNNIFCASNPAKLPDALWSIIHEDVLHDLIIFLPSRRAVRAVEKMIVEKRGATLLPQLIALGEGVDEYEEEPADVVSNIERVLLMAKLLTADPNIRTISNALPIAKDLVRMQDYLDNEGIDINAIDWGNLVDEKYAAHFQHKAKFLSLISGVAGGITASQKRNEGIRNWIKVLGGDKKVIVCGSTASVPATADLMAHVAHMPNGYIILPGKVNECGAWSAECGVAYPYYCELNFLESIGVVPKDVKTINVGESNISFLNDAFSNGNSTHSTPHSAFWLIEAARESEEAECIAEICGRAIKDNKTVLVITPDAAGNQRIATALGRRDMIADFSGGTPAGMTNIGRAILNWLDEKIENGEGGFEIGNLFEKILFIAEQENLSPKFEIDEQCAEIWDVLENVSDILCKNGIIITTTDARAIIADTLSGIKIRPELPTHAKISVLGTIESRMQTADVVILTGLNEGMFPAIGYENAWLPRALSEKIGLPSSNRKVSLMALDFMNLSCGAEIYWTRSRTAGGSQTTESRFLSRVQVAYPSSLIHHPSSILDAVRARDDVPYKPMIQSAPRPIADRTDVYVTELELLIHNPYAFYARHILRLKPKKDYWAAADARDFGNLVHSVIEHAAGKSERQLLDEMDRRAREILEQGNVVFHFWHKRFVEIAPAIVQMHNASLGGFSEIKLETQIAGRRVRAIADRVWDNVVLDIKTGATPNKTQLLLGNMPQLPLEAYMRGASVMQFLQLQNNNVKLIEYDGEMAQQMIKAGIQKISELFGRYSKDFEPYEYYETSDAKYKAYDDLARVND